MRLGIMREFVELGNCLSFSKAAKRLHLSQPALSMHISKLEKDLGVTLVCRDRPVHLTAAGKMFYDHAGRMLVLHEEAVRACRELDQSAERGRLLIKVDYAHASIKIPFRQLVADFHKEHPSIEISTIPEMGKSENLLEKIPGRRVNVWFYSTSCDGHVEAHEKLVGARALLMNTSSLALWMRPNHPLASKDCVTLADVDGARYPLPMGEQFAELRDAAESVVAECGAKPIYRGVLADTFEDYLMEIADDEVFLMVEHPLDPERDRLVCRLLDPVVEHRNYLMVKTDAENPALELFLDFVRDRWTPTRSSMQEG